MIYLLTFPLIKLFPLPPEKGKITPGVITPRLNSADAGECDEKDGDKNPNGQIVSILQQIEYHVKITN